MTSSGQGQNDVIMTSPVSCENSGRVNDRVRIRVGPGQNLGRTGSKFRLADDVSKRLPNRDAPVGTAARLSVTRRGLSCALRRVAARPASSGVVPPINFIVSMSRFQLCNNIQLFYVLILIYGKL